MPSVPEYIHHISAGLDALRAMPEDWIDRRGVEEILGISKWSAWRLLKRCGVEPGPGGALVVRREELIDRLERIRTGAAPAAEINRRNRVEDYLASIARYARSNRKLIAVGEQEAGRVLGASLDSLPPGVSLETGHLSIDFNGLDDLLTKVAAVVYALDNDYERIESIMSA